jgi:probable rRNA maturation factor
MDVFVADEQAITVDTARLAELARHTLDAEDIDEAAELSVLLVSAEHIKTLNSRFAGEDHPTDVLAFPMMEEEDESDGSVILGDVVICPEIAQGNADKLDHSLEHEMDVLLVHGTLHLLGYDHQGDDDKRKMDGRLTEVLEGFAGRSLR